MPHEIYTILPPWEVGPWSQMRGGRWYPWPWERVPSRTGRSSGSRGLPWVTSRPCTPVPCRDDSTCLALFYRHDQPSASPEPGMGEKRNKDVNLCSLHQLCKNWGVWGKGVGWWLNNLAQFLAREKIHNIAPGAYELPKFNHHPFGGSYAPDSTYCMAGI